MNSIGDNNALAADARRLALLKRGVSEEETTSTSHTKE